MTSPADHALAWRAALPAQRPAREPSPRHSATVWPTMREHALKFLEHFGARAVELGWTAEDLFGVHLRLGIWRVDHASALVLGVRRPNGFDAHSMRHGPMTFYRVVPGRPVGIPICQFKE